MRPGTARWWRASRGCSTSSGATYAPSAPRMPRTCSPARSSRPCSARALVRLAPRVESAHPALARASPAPLPLCAAHCFLMAFPNRPHTCLSNAADVRKEITAHGAMSASPRHSSASNEPGFTGWLGSVDRPGSASGRSAAGSARAAAAELAPLGAKERERVLELLLSQVWSATPAPCPPDPPVPAQVWPPVAGARGRTAIRAHLPRAALGGRRLRRRRRGWRGPWRTSRRGAGPLRLLSPSASVCFRDNLHP